MLVDGNSKKRQDRSAEAWKGFSGSPSLVVTAVGKVMALSPLWDPLMNFALKVLQQNTLSPWSRNFIPVLDWSFQFVFYF